MSLKEKILLYLQKGFLFSKIFILCLFFISCSNSENIKITPFDGKKAFEYLKYQCSLPPRIPSISGHKKLEKFIIKTLKKNNWQVELQKFSAYYELLDRKLPMINIIAYYPDKSQSEYILIGAHYDSRAYADRDKKNPRKPLPAANDGASGVAILLELSDALKHYKCNKGIILFFIDGEDGGKKEEFFCMGSKYFAKNYKFLEKIKKVIIIDMVGDKDLKIYKEGITFKHFPDFVNSFWKTASLYYPENFVDRVKYSIYDDSVPFVKKGIPTVEVIDFDYPYWHTLEDTYDKCSPVSLQVVGDTILLYLEKEKVIF